MKTILVPTDHSKAAKNAAIYALNLANVFKTDIELCYAFSVPVESPMVVQTAWALYDYPTLQEINSEELKKLAKILNVKERILWGGEDSTFYPAINYTCEEGDVVQVINDTAEKKQTMLIIMGMQGAGKLARFLFGSNSLKMVEKTKHPLLLIPYNHKYKGVKKIAFTTDLNQKDIETAQSLIEFAKILDAELYITHITPEANDVVDQVHDHTKTEFFKKLNGKIYYDYIQSKSIKAGMDLLKNKDFDMLVMGHQHKSFFTGLIKGSHAVKQARELKIPLMIIPQGAHTFL